MLIQTYQKSWANDFRKIKKVIMETLSGVDVDIEHIGSTSIANLAAKPIIDIDIVYGENTNVEDIISGLKKLGYYHNGNQGIKDREAFKRHESPEKHSILDAINHHLYVCPIKSEELQRHLLFRDFLIKNEREKKQYEEIKYKIAKAANQNRKIYAELKEVKAKEFIESIIKKAREGKQKPELWNLEKRQKRTFQ